MAAFMQFDGYLSEDFPDDYWADEGILDAHQMVREFVEADWMELQHAWKHRSEAWQIRCAQVLPHGAPEFSVPALLSMLNSDYREVRMMALDSLREVDLGRVPIDKLDFISSEVARCQATATPIESKILGALEKQVASLRQ